MLPDYAEYFMLIYVLSVKQTLHPPERKGRKAQGLPVHITDGSRLPEGKFLCYFHNTKTTFYKSREVGMDEKNQKYPSRSDRILHVFGWNNKRTGGHRPHAAHTTHRPCCLIRNIGLFYGFKRGNTASQHRRAGDFPPSIDYNHPEL